MNKALPWPRTRLPAPGLGLVGLGALLACLTISATLGAYGPIVRDWHAGGAEVFWHIRAPRLLMGLIAGAALGVAGAQIQGLFRNPLADPGLIGVSAGAALGAAMAIVLGSAALGTLMGPWALMIAAFIGGLGVTALTWHLSRREGRVQIARLLLMGIAINAAAGAALGWLSFMASDEQLRSLTFWLLGSLGGSQWPPVLVCAAIVVLAIAWPLAAPSHARGLNALSLGEAQAHLMGIQVRRLQRHCLLSVALSVGAVTALVGMVGFVGLLAPHVVRQLAGPDHRRVLPGSAVVGACLVLLADAGARTLAAPAELPLGVLTGLMGALAFMFILHRRRMLA
ncbi:MAG TPA: iron ABC transporter permease [Aquabacterium sp.]|uniref:FecCD family ABC transporter permease n=1 Tax=Aquabacterium sp. TaxID=1872578 RepID=UPI002E34F680|nr:iron ABC transporter permease [Aquabacterium sp.]HEX5372534.1 iron ABC transporter permease [Aquabacterium sp.]